MGALLGVLTALAIDRLPVVPRGADWGEHTGLLDARELVPVALLVEGDVDRDREGDLLDVLPDGDSEPERDLVFFFGLEESIRLVRSNDVSIDEGYVGSGAVPILLAGYLLLGVVVS